MDRIISNRYAVALFELAKEKELVKSYHEQTGALLVALEESSELDGVLKHPRINADKKLSLVKNIFGNEICDDIYGLIAIMLKKGREDELKNVFLRFDELSDEYERKTCALVESAFPLDNERQEKIRQRLSEKLNKDVELTVRTDPELIGGIRISVAGRIFDGTVKNELNNIKKALI